MISTAYLTSLKPISLWRQLSVAAGLLFSSIFLHGAERPIVGAIRWDAWTGGPYATKQTARSLGPEKYRDRLPWFGEPIDANTVKIHGGRQEIMDQDIEFAANAGLDYWAFLTYPEDSDMTEDLNQYLQSSKRKQIKFCLILHHFFGSSEETWPRELERVVNLLQAPDYVKVLGNRPLLYTFAAGEIPSSRWQAFIAAANARGLFPYCVYMGWSPDSDYQRQRKLGYDAVSAYAMGSSKPKFSDLVRSVEEKYWQAAAHSNTPYIPMVTTGWDKRPRQDNPVSWELNDPYHQQKVFPGKATPEEIADHLRRALDFVRDHQQICAANAIIIYAWNEFDEGGWISPTRGADGKPDTSRLDAIKPLLQRK